MTAQRKDFTPTKEYSVDVLESTVDEKDEAPVKPIPDIAADSKVCVWGNGDELKLRQCSSHFKTGDCHTFDGGHTSWTEKSTSAWD